ncbi:MAG: B12-binding domain-containing radical SAM protein, partial [Syntrophales bacterium LBB04]|nr:B12-binding domain-containing radical SAM protein [Syntrophales bacterium LBB04]
LPYDPSRGCYWRKCAFCHYGLAEQGAARYRERPASTVAFHLLSLQKKYQHRLFYFSHDTLAPRFAREIALKLQAAQADFRWSSDIRPEPAFTADCCHTLRQGGALSFSLGMESASPRILKRMEKGIQQDSMLEVMRHLKTADIAAEAMCFTDFPTETRDEALMTIKALEKLKPALSLFICGEFGLMHGAKVALDPPRYGLAETWHVSGDDLHTTLFYREQKPSKSEQDRALINAAIAKLAQHYWLHGYPWAGSLSTAHTLIHYLHLGRDAFKIQAQKRLVSHRPFSTHLDEGSVQGRALQFRPRLPEKARFRLDEEEVQMNESLIWDQLVNQRRTVSRELYHELAQKLPNKKPFRRLRRQR